MITGEGVKRNYGRLLVEMVSIVPDGIVCLFVSFSYIDRIINSWNEKGILKVRIYNLSYVLAKFISRKFVLFLFLSLHFKFVESFSKQVKQHIVNMR